MMAPLHAVDNDDAADINLEASAVVVDDNAVVDADAVDDDNDDFTMLSLLLMLLMLQMLLMLLLWS